MPNARRRRAAILRFTRIDNQAELLPRIRAERARRALYAACERAPLGWEARQH